MLFSLICSTMYCAVVIKSVSKSVSINVFICLDIFFLLKENFILFVFRPAGREILQLFLFPWWPINFIPQVEVTSPCPLQHPTPRLIHICYFTSKPASMSHGFITRSVDFHFLCSQLWNDTCIYIRTCMFCWQCCILLCSIYIRICMYFGLFLCR